MSAVIYYKRRGEYGRIRHVMVMDANTATEAIKNKYFDGKEKILEVYIWDNEICAYVKDNSWIKEEIKPMEKKERAKRNRYVYFQPNKKDLKDKVGDCQIRALCKVLDKSWVEAFDLTIPMCRELQTYTIFDCDLDKTKECMSRLGFEYHGVSNKRGMTRPTIDDFAKTHTQGRFICKVAHHVVAVVDGKYYDTWDSGYKSMYGYYELKKGE